MLFRGLKLQEKEYVRTCKLDMLVTVLQPNDSQTNMTKLMVNIWVGGSLA